ncbi:MAG: DUF2924 domain-containing protein [Planctomycetes bacterium]|nr:DUF2924 domain-containing protein [Planctomycetota bacterium]
MSSGNPRLHVGRPWSRPHEHCQPDRRPRQPVDTGVGRRVRTRDRQAAALPPTGLDAKADRARAAGRGVRRPAVGRQGAIARLNADVTVPTAAPPRSTPITSTGPRPGTVLQREWRGQQIRVEVTADGFVWNGNRYGSLSAVAFAITGAKWNGKLFFGLTERKA